MLGAQCVYQSQSNKLGCTAVVQKQHDGAEALVASQGKELAAVQRELQALKEQLSAGQALHAAELQRQAQVCSVLGMALGCATCTICIS